MTPFPYPPSVVVPPDNGGLHLHVIEGIDSIRHNTLDVVPWSSVIPVVPPFEHFRLIVPVEVSEVRHQRGYLRADFPELVVVELLLSERVGESNNLTLPVPAYCPHAIPVVGFIDDVFETRGSKQVAKILDVAGIPRRIVVDFPDIKKPPVVSG